MSAKQMKLGLVMFPTGAHVAAWRDPRAEADGHIKLAHIVNTVQLAERALFDLVFFADSVAVRGSDNLQKVKRQPHVTGFEPVTLIAALAAVTHHIGLVSTSSTTFHQPYQVARQFASIDLLSGGRAGINVVTSTEDIEARNFGMDHILNHADRYERAQEFLDVMFGLWDSWDHDAFVRDKASGVFFDPAKAHVLDHRGKYFSVRGPLNVPRSPQGRPVIVQAGSSEAGRDFAARTTEVVFTAQTMLAQAQAFYADLKQRAVNYGRAPNTLAIMPGLHPVIGATKEEAQRKLKAFGELIHPDMAVAQLSTVMGGFDLSRFPIDGPLPFDAIPETNGPKSRQQLLLDKARNENLTIRQLATVTAQSYGHNMVVGTAEDVADHMEQWVADQACDGFILNASLLPSSLEDLADGLIPELQRRGLFRRAYEGTTLRENLGLPVPPSRYDNAPSNVARMQS